MSVDKALAKMTDPAWWEQLCPELTIHGKPRANFAFDETTRAAFRRDIRTEGYFQLAPRLEPAEIRALLSGVLRIRKASLLPLFVFMYAETWHVFHRLDALWRLALDGDWRLLPSFWAWYVAQGDNNAGWPPHRDRTSQPVLRDGGMPVSLTCWIPLTPTTPLNGCMYIVPMQHQPSDVRSIEPQMIRALPAAAGSILGWNHNVVHWGGMSTDKAPCPRVSLSFELQRADAPPLHRPLFAPGELPELRIRLALAGRMILLYDHMSRNDQRTIELARALCALAPELPDPPKALSP